MRDTVVTNWFGDVSSRPQCVVDATSLDDIVRILKDIGKYPSPVRAVGSNHSTTPCATAEGGTLIRMKMNRILHVGTDTVTVEGGAIYIDISEELRKHKLQFYVTTEIGNLSAGSAACCGTKDSSFEGEFGQVGSYVIGLKMVLPSGELVEVKEDQLDLMQKVRASYGTFGIVYEVTFRVRPLTPLAVHHKTFQLADFIAQFPQLKNQGYSMMFFMFPFADKITVEFRKYNPTATGTPNRSLWRLRNYVWATGAPKFARYTEQFVPIKSIRYGMIDSFYASTRLSMETVLHSDNTLGPDQTIRYPSPANDGRYTFSLFAFPEDGYLGILKEYFQFNRDYYKEKGYRSNMLSVGYRIAQDTGSFLSYSHDGPVMTLDPVSTANPGWETFLDAYNQFCSERGGRPLFNQTPQLTRAMAVKAFGDKLNVLEETRQQFDPGERLLNQYFREMFGTTSKAFRQST